MMYDTSEVLGQWVDSQSEKVSAGGNEQVQSQEQDLQIVANIDSHDHTHHHHHGKVKRLTHLLHLPLSSYFETF